EHTQAECDQNHLNIVLMSMATTPDRTDYITGKSPVSPLPDLKRGIEKLNEVGAGIIAVPCNTAHTFYPEISAVSRAPILNIVEETVFHAKQKGACRLGILATNGTVRSLSYQRVCRDNGLSCVFPDEVDQSVLMTVIYDRIKKARKPDFPQVQSVIRHLTERGCDMMILGCTELSLIPDSLFSPYPVLDSLHVLALRSILSCGGTPIGFSPIYQ
ncbi:MAG: aspartate/glutamate racemase family protein, partial [Ruminococcus sp.]|nr:aspartate/glutamate racemase family protein [Candidatus Apopatosoma intestinale]